MKTHIALLLAASLAAPLRAQFPGGDPCPDYGLLMERATNGNLLVTWQAAAGTTQLYHAPMLGDPATWRPVPGAVPRPDGSWQVEVPGGAARAFFKVEPAVTPLPPPNVRLVMTGDHFRLEWDSSCDAAGYMVYVGLTPDVGPQNHSLSLPLPMANGLEITGLNPGQTYYITIAAINAAGEGAPGPALSGIYGPKGLFSGRAVWSYGQPGCTECEAFTVEAEGAEIQLMSFGAPGTIPLSGTADEQGQFRIPLVPAGTYYIGWQVNGQAGFLQEPVEMTADGVVRSPLVLPSGPLPPPPATTLLGTLTLSTGDAPRINVPEFGIHSRAELRADFADGSSRTIIPDRRGAWALPDVTGGFPVVLKATYQGLVKVVDIPAPPAELTPVEIRFTERLPKLHRLTAWQNGAEVMEIAPGVPVTFQPEVDNPDHLPENPRWIAEYNGKKYLSAEPAPVFLFDTSPAYPDEVPEGGLVRLQYIPSPFTAVDIGPFSIGVGTAQVQLIGVGCWSGMAGLWNPSAPLDINGAHPATVTVTHSGVFTPSVANTFLTSNGRSYFELPLDPVTVPPYLVRVDKPGHMRFLWPFEFQLPKEGTYCLVPATTWNLAQTGSLLTIQHPGGATLNIPYGSLLTPGNTQWFGNIVVQMTTWNPLDWTPLPPNAEVRGPNLRNGMVPYGCVWFDITTDTGISLTPAPTATLTVPIDPGITDAEFPGYHQVESTGYFERWGFPNNKATKIAAGRYNISLGAKGLIAIGTDTPLLEVVFEADRSLNYPFDIRLNRSIFPVTITGACQNNFGHLYQMSAPRNLYAQVLDEREAPGIFYTNPAAASFSQPVPSQRKPNITYAFDFMTSPPPAVLPAIAVRWVRVSMGERVVKLKNSNADTTVTAIDGANHFLSRMTNTAADAATYYQKIQAPATLTQWRALNGFPAAFGGTISGVGYDKYATCYYYNLGDLGFARAQTMRITTGSDNQPNVAFAVTNYPTLEDARCKRSPIATVCMDNALRNDLNQVTPSRYTRFYVYGPTGSLLDCANLDGGGLKCVPNLCVVCHGGTKYPSPATLSDTTNLGSRFLPFDLESYTWHPKYGVQKQELAAMNAGVLQTAPNSTITDLITGWYGNANPIASSAVWNNFNAAYMPTAAAAGWNTNPPIYKDVFKQSCRVCHVSRDAGFSVQFDSLTKLSNSSYGYGSACSGLSMPHSQRTWAVFWGSRGINGLSMNTPVPDQPATLVGPLGPTLKCRPPP